MLTWFPVEPVLFLHLHSLLLLRVNYWRRWWRWRENEIVVIQKGKHIVDNLDQFRPWDRWIASPRIWKGAAASIFVGITSFSSTFECRARWHHHEILWMVCRLTRIAVTSAASPSAAVGVVRRERVRNVMQQIRIRCVIFVTLVVIRHAHSCCLQLVFFVGAAIGFQRTRESVSWVLVDVICLSKSFMFLSFFYESFCFTMNYSNSPLSSGLALTRYLLVRTILVRYLTPWYSTYLGLSWQVALVRVIVNWDWKAPSNVPIHWNPPKKVLNKWEILSC